MKDKRMIKIQDPRLRKIRNNLRMVVIEAGIEERKKLTNEWRAISDTKSVNDMSPSELKHFRYLQDLISEKRQAIYRSICMCNTCGRADRDMVYNKPYDAWYCVECYDGTKKFYEKVKQERLEKGIAKADYDDFDEEYHESFADPDLRETHKEKHGKDYEKKEFWI